MRRFLKLLNLLVIPFLLLIAPSAGSISAAPPKPPVPGAEDEIDDVRGAIEEAVVRQREDILGFLVFDVRIIDIQISDDGQWGIAFLEMVDPDTNETLPAEPGLAIAVLEDGEWQVSLPADPNWAELIVAVPEDLLPPDEKATYLEINAAEIGAPDAVYSGYLLPWAAGQTVYLSQSVGHDQYTPSGTAHYAFDFYISKTMYQLYASIAGTVWKTRWDVPNGDSSDMGNYLVTMDTTTSPTTFVLYLHLAQDSIPAALRTTGTYVAQGQFIGLADDTGQSTGHHLHFQVHANPASYWGTSVDITFNDVDINGGRPRILSDLPYCKPTDVCEEFRNWYISENVVHGDTTPPSGGLFEPATGFTLNNQTLHVEGWASDVGSGLDRAQLIAYFNDEWNDVGGEFSSQTFSTDWDVCDSGAPDGPVSLALKAWDNEGNLSLGYPGLTHLIKNYDCQPPPPACAPGINQVGIYSDTDFRGACLKLNLGDYANSTGFASLGEDNVESLQVGSNVIATLYSDPDYSGRSTTFSARDSNLDENPVGRNTLSSLSILSKATPPSPPSELVAPLNGASFPGNSSLSLSWRDPGGATQYQARLNGPSGQVDSPWMVDPFWHLDSVLLSTGDYTWKVRARNCPELSCQSAWSGISTFMIDAPPIALPVTTPPFNDGMESGTGNWHFSGLWNRLNGSAEAHSGSYSWYYGDAIEGDYADGAPNTGDLTLRSITIPGSGYALRFWYRYQTESAERVWDQRWVQISTDGSSYVNLVQLKDDVSDYWLQSTLDLSAYAGQTIQIRFHFETLDDLFNAENEGWYIDDIEVSQLELPSCTDDDDILAKAILLEYGVIKNAMMCPTGDVDYYRFEGTAGDHIVLDVDTPAETPVDNLDLILYLFDSDGRSVLAIHDDEIYGEKLDPHLGYQLVRSDTYYVRAQLWAHPTYGDEDFAYQITLTEDNQKPTGDFTDPLDGTYLEDTDQLALTVSAGDAQSGVSRVEFQYHSGDWAASDWQVLGADEDGSDGWSQTFDVASLAEQKNVVFFAKILDWAGNWAGTGAWNLGIDRTDPATAMISLGASQQSTAVKLQWSASDNLSGIEHLDLQYQIGTGSWMDYEPDPPVTSTQIWYIGQPGTLMGYRMRGLDVAGNQESYPASAETSTTIPSASSLCSAPDLSDSGGNDNSPATSTLVEVGSASKTHNFCNPLTPDRLYDEDWVRFNVETGKNYQIQAIAEAEMTAAILELYAANGSTLIASASSTEFGSAVELTWTADRTGKVYLRIRHTDGRVAGNIVSYELSVTDIQSTYLPLVNR
jgi:murein DD-endopeptidase MepM/ murein hydrolase activator NlpD